jgi:ribonuclease HI
MLIEDALNIYSDGSSYAGPRAGGIGIIFVIVNDTGDAEIINEFEYPGYRQANNQEMELEACIKGLDEALNDSNLQRYEKIEIFTDSRYVSDNYKRAMFEWPKTRWTNRQTGRAILHVSQWKRLVKLLKRASEQRRRVNIHWEKGKTHEFNKAADKAAKRSAKNPLNKPLSTVSVRRKTTDKQVEIGCVKMLGQRLKIRVITAEWLPSPQRCFKYKYEVLSKNSRFYKNVDVIFSAETLLHRHTYIVLVNKTTANPRIVRVLKEIAKDDQPAR